MNKLLVIFFGSCMVFSLSVQASALESNTERLQKEQARAVQQANTNFGRIVSVRSVQVIQAPQPIHQGNTQNFQAVQGSEDVLQELKQFSAKTKSQLTSYSSL